MKNEEVSALIF